ncbi:TTL-domain-containing protein [Neocallimastix lanati (nom. inval.)]|jgi:tubulin polyglutamylase TTLL9|uniref:Tubulin--tyrosine ligase-like protein 9 n=1 Tax=Neocallimastix californiae TaxID=1754190 RepID=A0A1Y2CGQ3_9FUNG|nr:TTL-domain-containing protein [Neocallimastix sp. JGI-2020a]ORY46209.1 TTL-domain-containing protein [Neocallimastix californiae]|eukprot:ORY46209.1 TTL-domain-containing protein [Neocallimastix californiae]
MLKSNYSSSSSSFSLEKRSSDEKNENLHKHEIKQPHIIIPHPPEMPETFDSFLTKEINPGCKDPRSIRFKTFLRNTLLDTLRKRRWKETDDEIEWDVYWADIRWIHENFDHVYLNDHQKINHFRNHYELTRKDLLVKNVKRMIKTVEKEYGKDEAAKFDFISTSFVLPQDYALFQEEFKKNPGSIWIMKPVGRAQGKGIFLINKISQINQWKKDPRLTRSNSESQDQVETYIIQRYIENPYLIGGKKFDIRIYALVLSYSPLTVYIHRNGFCRFSNSNFTMDTKDISNLYIHATNVAIQKTSPNYNVGKGCKWLLYNLRNYLSSKHGDEVVDTLMTNIEMLIVRSLMSVQKVMINDKHCFELYGFDILIDQEFKPWLLEVNASPSLTAETHRDYELKFDVINDMFDVIDIEKNIPAEKKPLPKVGGFDLVYHDGPIQHERASKYKSYLGCYKNIPKRELRNKKHNHHFTNTSESSIQK